MQLSLGSISKIGHSIILVFSQKNQNMLSYLFFWKYVFNNELLQCTVNWKLLYMEFRIQKISDPMVVPNLRLVLWLGLMMSNNKNECEIHFKVIVSQIILIIEWEYKERAFWKIIESFLRDYREFLRDYREYFEKVKRDYKERVKNFQGYLDFEQNIRKFWL